MTWSLQEIAIGFATEKTRLKNTIFSKMMQIKKFGIVDSFRPKNMGFGL